jgi:hypothetical protein
MAHVKSSCEDFAQVLVYELEVKFPNHELMSALGVIYLNFWPRNLQDVENDFHKCLIGIKATCYNQQKVGKDGMWVDVLLHPYEFDL